MSFLFYAASLVAIISSLMVVTRSNAVHALLYLVVSLLAVALIFFILGAPFIAALEVIIYAGAIMVLFIFVVMMFNLAAPFSGKSRLLDTRTWAGPVFLSFVLFGEFLAVITSRGIHRISPTPISPKDVGISLFGTYLLGVELAAMLLLSGVVGAFHLGRQKKRTTHRFFEIEAPK
jgi:NADH-quinone oxidoreductase subunit J